MFVSSNWRIMFVSFVVFLYFRIVKKGLQGNIYRLYIIKMAKWFSLIMPIIVLFFQENGLSMTQILTLKAVYSVGMLTMEIPSGYFGDVWGRKKTLIAGSVLTTIGFSIYAVSGGFWIFLIAELVLGIGQSFVSGADSAMLYDSLKEMKLENKYIKYEGRVTSIGNFSEAIAGVIGGFLAIISLRTPFIAQAALSGLAIPAAFTLIEPTYRLEKRLAGLKDVFKIVKYALVTNLRLRNFIFLSSIIGTATLTYAWFIQPYFIAIKLPLAWYGILWTALNLTVGIFSVFAHKIETRFGKRNIILVIIVSVFTGFLLTGTFVSPYALPVLFGFYMIRGIATPVLKDYLNELIDSDVRATILSLRNMVIRILFALFAPVLGWLNDTYSLRTSFYIAGITYSFLGLLVLISVIRQQRYNSNDSSS